MVMDNGVGLTVGARDRLGRGEQRGKNWDNYNRITIIKINLKNFITKTDHKKEKYQLELNNE